MTPNNRLPQDVSVAQVSPVLLPLRRVLRRLAVRVTTAAHRQIMMAAAREEKAPGQVVSDLAKEHLPAVEDLTSTGKRKR